MFNKIKRNIGSKNGNSYAFIHVNATKNLTNSSYNNWLGILGAIGLGGLSLLALTSAILYSPLFQSKNRKFKKKNK